MVDLEAMLTSPKVVSSVTDEPSESSEAFLMLATIVMPVKAALLRRLAADNMIARAP